MGWKGRALAGNTMEPCPGCGSEPGYGGRKRGTVCSVCQTLIGEARARREAREAEVVVARVPNLMPHISGTSAYVEVQRLAEGIEERAAAQGGVWRQSAAQRFQLVFRKLAKAMGPEVTQAGEVVVPDRTGYDWRGCGSESVEMRRDVAELLTNLYLCVMDIAAEAGAVGYERGQKLLAGLATGEVSVAKFNELTVGKDRS